MDHLEIIFIHLLYLLAHHPDFSTAQKLQSRLSFHFLSSPTHFTFLDVLNYTLILLRVSDNVALLYHLAMKAKTVRDSESHTYSEVQRFFTRLLHMLIFAESRTSIRCRLRPRADQGPRARSLVDPSEPPGKVKFPSDILRALLGPGAVAKASDMTPWIA